MATEAERLRLTRATLLGQLQKYDESKTGVVPAPNFVASIKSLGLNFGEAIVDSLMVQCRIDDEGSVDYSELREAVAREFEQGPSDASRGSTTRPTSQSVSSQPIRPSVAHEKIAAAQQQSRLVRSKHSEVLELFQSYDHGELGQDDLRGGLRSLGIRETSDLDMLLAKTSSSELTYNAFIRALTLSDHASGGSLAETQVLAGSQLAGDARSGAQAAGGRKPNHNEGEFGSWAARKRTDPRKNFAHRERSDEGNAPQRIPGKKQTVSKHLYDSTQLNSHLEHEIGPRNMVTASKIPVTGAGDQGDADQCESAALVNSKFKLLRHQIYAAVRKMDSGGMTATEFQDKLFTLGVEIPADVLRLLQSHDSSGAAAFRDFMQAFERHFEARCSELDVASTVASGEVLKAMKARLFARFGHSGIQQLSNRFIAHDRGSGSLAFAPFTRALASAELELETAQVQTLFNSYDRVGDGSIDHRKLVKDLSGPLKHARIELVRDAFRLLDRAGLGAVDLRSLRSSFNVAKHPDVEAGARTAKDVREEFVATLTTQHDDGMLSADEFETYYRNLSALIEDDASFEALIRGVWTLADKPPPPPSFAARGGGKGKPAPLAAQTHGSIISWNQSASGLETRSATKERNPRISEPAAQRQSYRVSDWNKHSSNTAQDEMNTQFGVRRSTPTHQAFLAGESAGQGGFLNWPTTKTAAPAMTTQASDQAERTRSSAHPTEVRERSMHPIAAKHLCQPAPFGVDASVSIAKKSPSKSTAVSLSALMG